MNVDHYRIMIRGACIVFGTTLALANWYTIVASRKSGRFVSTVPLFGAILLFAGLSGFERTRPYAWFGIIADYGTLVFIAALPKFIREIWQTSRINLVRRFKCQEVGRHVDIRLYKGGIWIIELEHRGKRGEFRGSICRTGSWREAEGVFYFEGYGPVWALSIQPSNGEYRSEETIDPSDGLRVEDRLDSLRLKRVK
jgi:hypothetical protein